MLGRLQKILSRLSEGVFPFIHYVVHKRRKLAEAHENPVVDAIYENESEDYLTERLKEEQSRSAAMDEKTFKMTLSLSLGLTIFGTLSPLLLSKMTDACLQFLCGLMIALSVFYALAGGFVALGAMRTLPSYGVRSSGLPKTNQARGAISTLTRLHETS